MTTRKSAIAIENDAHCLTYDYCGGGLLWNCVDDDAYDDACDDAWQASGAFAREGAKQISTGKKVIVSEKSEDCVDAEHDVGVGREETRQQVHAMLGPSWQLMLCLPNAPDWPPAF